MKLVRLRQCLHDAKTGERLLIWAGEYDQTAIEVLDAIVRAYNTPREAGALGGLARSSAKSAAARSNGRKGGRPRKRPKPETDPA